MNRVYDFCLNAFGSTNGPDFRGGRRDRRVTFEIARVTSWTNATARTAHAKPMRGMSRPRTMGRMTAPTEDPDATMPIAQTRRRLNHVETVATPGMNNLKCKRRLSDRGAYIPTAIPAPMP
jgi:hypothetical protein